MLLWRSLIDGTELESRGKSSDISNSHKLLDSHSYLFSLIIGSIRSDFSFSFSFFHFSFFFFFEAISISI